MEVVKLVLLPALDNVKGAVTGEPPAPPDWSVMSQGGGVASQPLEKEIAWAVETDGKRINTEAAVAISSCICDNAAPIPPDFGTSIFLFVLDSKPNIV